MSPSLNVMSANGAAVPPSAMLEMVAVWLPATGVTVSAAFWTRTRKISALCRPWSAPFWFHSSVWLSMSVPSDTRAAI